LLSRLLAKSPEFRISLDAIKRHPWYLQGDYHRDLSCWMSSGAQCKDSAIFDLAADLGVDPKQMAREVTSGEATGRTAVYFMLKRKHACRELRGLGRGNARERQASNKVLVRPADAGGRRVWTHGNAAAPSHVGRHRG